MNFNNAPIKQYSLHSGLKVIMYHYVRDIEKGYFKNLNALATKEFAYQIKYFNKNYHIISVEDLIAYIEEDKALPDNATILTFDDGYIDHYEQAMTTLKKHQITGAFYTPIEAIENRKLLDVNCIHAILSEVTNRKLLMDKVVNLISDFKDHFKLHNIQHFVDRYHVKGRYDDADTVFVKQMLQRVLPKDLRKIILDQLLLDHVQLDFDNIADLFYMKEQHLKELAQEGHHIGVHGHKHLSLNTLSREEQIGEIHTSLDYLRKVNVLPKKWSICYPYGHYNEDTLQILKDLDCSLGFVDNSDKEIIDIKKSHLLINRLDTNLFPKGVNQ
jgi:peptidoglycan/xylan/chitin deacetylase (PgdA/CDA1 family)